MTQLAIINGAPLILNFRDFCHAAARPLSLQAAFSAVLQYYRLIPPCEIKGVPHYIKFTSATGFITDPIGLILQGSLNQGFAWQVFSTLLQGQGSAPFREMMEHTQFALRPFFPHDWKFYETLQEIRHEWAQNKGSKNARWLWEAEMKHLAREFGPEYFPSQAELPGVFRALDMLNAASFKLKGLIPSI